MKGFFCQVIWREFYFERIFQWRQWAERRKPQPRKLGRQTRHSLIARWISVQSQEKSININICTVVRYIFCINMPAQSETGGISIEHNCLFLINAERRESVKFYLWKRKMREKIKTVLISFKTAFKHVKPFALQWTWLETKLLSLTAQQSVST